MKKKGVLLPSCSNIGRSTNCHALVVLVDTGSRPNDVDLAGAHALADNLRPQPRQPPPVREVC
jgi:hypothetical protein